MYMLMGITAGFTRVLSRSVNAELAKRTNIHQSTFFNYLTGLSLSFLLMILIKEPGQYSSMKEVFANNSWFIFTGGLLGVVTVAVFNKITLHISAFLLTILVFVSQMTTGMLIDYLFYHTFSLGKLLGTGIICLGLFIYNKPVKE